MDAFTLSRRAAGAAGFPPLPHALEVLSGPHGSSSNVIIRHFLLCGGHPGGSASEAVSNLNPLLRAGITGFVCLQGELPSPSGASHSRAAYAARNVVTARPYLSNAQAMVDAGGYPQSSSRPLGFLHFPWPEVGVPPDDALKPFLLDVLSYLKGGEYLYLHCSDGNGRTGVVAACLLGLAYDLSSSEALDLTQRSRSDRPGSTSGRCPESHDQVMAVHRLLNDSNLRAAAARTTPRLLDTSTSTADATLGAIGGKIRVVLQRKGALSAVYLRRYASTLSDGRDNLNRDAFNRLVADAEWHLTPFESDTLFNALAASGTAAIESLWRAIAGPTPARRSAAISAVFQRLADPTLSFVPVERLAASFHAESHPDVRATRRSREEVTSEFYDTFGIAGRGRTPVTRAEFESYYRDVSMALSDDAAFELLIFGSWPFNAHESASERYADRAGLTSTGSAATGHGAAATGGGGGGRNAGGYTTSSSAASRHASVAQNALAQALHRVRGSGADLNTAGNAIAAARAVAVASSDLTLPCLLYHLLALDELAAGTLDATSWYHAWHAIAPTLTRLETDIVFMDVARALGGAAVSVLDTTSIRLPLADAFRVLCDAPLASARHGVVCDTFNALDKDGVGSLPLTRLMAAFNAGAHPSVQVQKVALETVASAGRMALEGVVNLISSRIPTLRGTVASASPAGAAYLTAGVEVGGVVRMPFFESFHQALSVAYEDDTAFAVQVGRLWSGNGAFNASSVSAPQPLDGMLTAMGRLGGTGGTGGNRSYSAGVGYATSGGGGNFTHSSAVSSPNAFNAGGTATSVMTPSRPLPTHPGTRPATPAAVGRGAVTTVSGPAGMADVHTFKSTGAPHVDAALNVVRSQLLRSSRGMKAATSLVRALEGATARRSGQRGGRGDLNIPLPTADFNYTLRDSAMGLSQPQLEALDGYLDERGEGAIVPLRFIAAVTGGDPSQSRLEVIMRAYHHLCSTSPSGGPLTLDDVVMGFKSSAHPDVRAYKRTEEEVLRDFLECFNAAEFIADDRTVPFAGFKAYYTLQSALIEDDVAFASLLYDTWALHAEDRAGVAGMSGKRVAPALWRSATGMGSEGPSAGRPTHTDAPGIAGAWTPTQRARTRDIAFSDGTTRAATAHAVDTRDEEFSHVIKGHGLERMGYGYHQSKY